jgi:hypothetical protein
MKSTAFPQFKLDKWIANQRQWMPMTADMEANMHNHYTQMVGILCVAALMFIFLFGAIHATSSAPGF